MSDNTSSAQSNGNLKNRLSAKHDEQMGSASNENQGDQDGPRKSAKSASDENLPNIVRHGYGV